MFDAIALKKRDSLYLKTERESTSFEKQDACSVPLFCKPEFHLHS